MRTIAIANHKSGVGKTATTHALGALLAERARKIALANPDGEFNPGDGLIVTYANCWIDDPANNIELLFNGSITLTGYIENRSPFSTGFDQITFNSLAENETETAGQVVTVVQPPVVTTGTMTLFVTP